MSGPWILSQPEARDALAARDSEGMTIADKLRELSRLAVRLDHAALAADALARQPERFAAPERAATLRQLLSTGVLTLFEIATAAAVVNDGARLQRQAGRWAGVREGHFGARFVFCQPVPVPTWSVSAGLRDFLVAVGGAGVAVQLGGRPARPVVSLAAHADAARAWLSAQSAMLQHEIAALRAAASQLAAVAGQGAPPPDPIDRTRQIAHTLALLGAAASPADEHPPTMG